MFMKKSKIAKVTMGYVVASLMFFGTVMPASAADMQFSKDFDTKVSIEEEAKDDFLNRSYPHPSDKTVTSVTYPDNGRTVPVMPRSDLGEQSNIDLNEAVEDTVTVEEETADEDEAAKVNKRKLAKAIRAASKLKEADYTAKSWDRLEKVLAVAKTVMHNDWATQKKVDKALMKLNKAVEALEEVVVEADKSELAAAVEAAGQLKRADYTADTWRVFASALAAAESVMADEEATQEEVVHALAELNSALDALEEVVAEEADKSELAAAIKAAGELDKADYTAKSWGNLEKALSIAETVMDDSQATQKEVDHAVKKLNNAMETLEEVVAEDEDQDQDQESVSQIGIYKELVAAFEKMQSSYDRLLDLFDNIFGN